MFSEMQMLYWTAGFLEAEGSFFFSGGKHLTVSAHQVQREPLARLQAQFGGRISYQQRNQPRHSPIYQWAIGHSHAAALAMTLYPIMSPKRQGQIQTALAAWRETGIRRDHRTHCPQGHPYSGENLYIHNGKRNCKACRSYAEMIRRGWRAAPTWENRLPGEKHHFRCQKGHPYTEDNIYIWNGKWYCRACRTQISKKQWEAKKQARLLQPGI